MGNNSNKTKADRKINFSFRSKANIRQCIALYVYSMPHSNWIERERKPQTNASEVLFDETLNIASRQ